MGYSSDEVKARARAVTDNNENEDFQQERYNDAMRKGNSFLAIGMLGADMAISSAVPTQDRAS